MHADARLPITRIAGGITAPRGVRASGLACGIKANGKPDLAVIATDRPVPAAGIFTTNQAKAAPVLVSQEHLAWSEGIAQVIVTSSELPPVRSTARSDTVSALGRHTAMRVLSAYGEFYRVRLPDGATGFVSARITEPADRVIARVRVGETILARPAASRGPQDIVAVVAEGDDVGVVGRFGEFALVRSARGVAGWVINQ